MDAVSYVDHAPSASSNLETIKQRGILADTWLPPAPEPWERLQLQRLVKVQLFFGIAAPGVSSIGRPQTNVNDSGFRLSQPCLTPKAFRLVFCCRNRGIPGRNIGSAPESEKASGTYDTSVLTHNGT